MKYGQEPIRLAMGQYAGESGGKRTSFHMMLNELTEPVGLHWHEFYELSFIWEGEGRHIRNGQQEQLVPGCMYLLTPADFHELLPNSQVSALRKYNVLFTQDWIDSSIFQLLFGSSGELSTVTFVAEDAAAVHADFHRLWVEYERHRDNRWDAIRLTLNRLLLDLGRMQAILEPAAMESQPGFIRETLAYIHHHFREPLTLPGLAGQCGWSPNYFSERFHKATGITLQRYVLDLRLRFAKSLLQTSSVSVTEACLASGFQTLSYMERAFKRRYGMTPRQVRDQPPS